MTGLYAEERGVEGREDNVTSSSREGLGRFNERSSCFGVEGSSIEVLSDSGSRVVHTVDKD